MNPARDNTIELETTADREMLYCRGHVTVEAFLHGVEKWNAWETEDWAVLPEEVFHATVREVPYSPHSDEFRNYSLRTYWLPAEPGARGAYKITYTAADRSNPFRGVPAA